MLKSPSTMTCTFYCKFSSYNESKHVRYLALISCQPGVITHGFVVRSMLKKGFNEAVKSNTNTQVSRQVYRFCHVPDGRMLRMNREMHDAFQVHFRDRCAHCPDLQLQKFRSSHVDFTRRGAAEVAGCEGVVTECKFRDALKHVGLNKSPGFDCLPKCTWGCRTYLCLFWWICSTIGSLREPTLVALSRAWSHCWKKVAGMFGRDLMITGP